MKLNKSMSLLDEVIKTYGYSLDEAVKKSMKGKKYNGKMLDDSIGVLLSLIIITYRKTTTIYVHRQTSKMIEFSALARQLLLAYATVHWILKEDSNVRATKFMDGGYTLYKYIHDTDRYFSTEGAPRTIDNGPGDTELIKDLDNGRNWGWYKELNFFVHPSAAIVTQHVVGEIDPMLFLSTARICSLFSESIIYLADAQDKVNLKKAKLKAQSFLDGLLISPDD